MSQLLASGGQNTRVSALASFKGQNRELTTPNGGEDVAQKGVSSVADGNAEWFSHLGREFSSFFFYKTKHTRTM